MKNLLIFTYGISLDDWERYGLISRELALYKQLSEKNKVKYTFLTFGNENDYKFAEILGNIEIIPAKKLINSKISKFQFLKSFLLPFKLRRVLKKIDIVKTNQINGSWIACIIKIFLKKKIIIRGGYDLLNEHINLSKKKGIKNLFIYLLKYFWIFIIELIAYKLADGIILTSDEDIKFIVKCFGLKKKMKNEKIRHFSNFIDVNLFKPLPITKRDKEVLFIGRLNPQKNLINLLKAFIHLKDFKLTILGEGKCKKDIVNLINKYGLNVTLLDNIQNTKIPQLLNQFKIFILPSIWEGNPKVLLEAMSCELACIGSNIIGIKNILEHKKNGYICEITPNSICNAILTLYNNETLMEKISKNARSFILNNCSLNSISKKEYTFYKNILKS